MTRRGKAVLAVCSLLGALACKPNDPPPAPEPSPAHSPTALQVPSDRLSRIQLSKKLASVDHTVTLEKDRERWRITSPIAYDAHAAVVEPMVAVFAEIEVLSILHGDERKARSFGLDPDSAIEVKGWAGDSLQSHFRIGHSTREQTHVQRPGDPRILTIRGRCRPLFDKTLDELRHPVITDVPLSRVEGVTYANSFGPLELRAGQGPGEFTIDGPPVRNFDRDRATKNVAVLCGLRAKGFVDGEGTPKQTGLFDDDTPRATLRLREPQGQRAIHVWVGNPTQDGRIHLRTSESEQIYLVAPHLRSSLVPRRSHFERSDETMKELAGHRHAHGDEHHDGHGEGKGAHTHGQAGPPPSQVPPELLEDLRALAQEQSRLTK